VTGHKYEMNPFVVSSTRWQNLDPAVRTVIEEAADEAQQEQRRLMDEQSEEIYAEFEQILEVTHPDRAMCREATHPAYARWQQKHPEFVAQITAAAEASRADHEESAAWAGPPPPPARTPGATRSSPRRTSPPSTPPRATARRRGRRSRSTRPARRSAVGSRSSRPSSSWRW